jgi:hypothetical protein
LPAPQRHTKAGASQNTHIYDLHMICLHFAYNWLLPAESNLCLFDFNAEAILLGHIRDYPSPSIVLYTLPSRQEVWVPQGIALVGVSEVSEG